MPSFNLTFTTTSAQTLNSGEAGVITQFGGISTIGAAAVTLSGSTQLVIAGTITAAQARAISAADGFHVISIGRSGVVANTGSDAIALSGISGATIVNDGSVTTSEDAVDLRLTGGSFGQIYLNNSGNATGFSDGLVLGTENGTSTIVNSGILSGTQGYGIAGDVGPTDTAGLIQITNTGVISGGAGAIFAARDQVRITNSGTIQGNVILGEANDSYDGRNGVLQGELQLNGGDDLARGGAGDEQFFGGAGNDILSGGAGDDSITGGSDIDVLDGGSGDDGLFGDSGNDVLRAGLGADSLFGGDGRDVMFGGENADQFVFFTNTESVVGSSRDVIRDFVRGLDVINLEQLIPGTFAFLGTAAFTGTDEEVRYVVTAGGSAVVQIDVNGDGVRDMEILVAQVPTLTVSDFLV